MGKDEFKIDYDFRSAATALSRSGKNDSFIQQAFGHAIQGDYRRAADIFESCASRKPGDYFGAYFHGGVCRLMNREPVKAYCDFNEAGTLRGENYWQCIFSGIASFYLGLIDEALISWFKAHVDSPSSF